MSRVFIALATWEPQLALLDRQLASLSAQSFRDWSGVVVDDGSAGAMQRQIAERVAGESRLRFMAFRDRAGFYRNFERALAAAPFECDYIALCDQDDRWMESKLERQVRTLDADPAPQLCYTDVRIVDDKGSTLAPTLWHARPHGRSFREVVYNNVVTGTTALFRRRLLDVALPFPGDPGGAFHDHWLALCAMATGGLAYLDEPLVDYTQHASNALGAQGLDHVGRGAVLKLIFSALRDAVMRPGKMVGRFDALASHAVHAEARLRSFASVLNERVAPLPVATCAALRPFLRRGRGARAFDLAGPTLLGTLAAGQETNLEPLKIPLGLAWAALRGRAPAK